MEAEDIKIFEANQKWADEYRAFCQKAYQAAYPRPELGVTKDLFSEKVFDSARIRTYFDGLLTPSKDNKFWLAVTGDRIVGGVGARKRAGQCEMIAFYVDPQLAGQGIGHRLYQKVREFALHLSIYTEVIEYMSDTISLYEHWGFVIDETKGKVLYPWTEWPQKAIDSYQAITMVRPAEQKL